MGAGQGVCTKVTTLRPRGGDKMCPVARLPTFPGSGPIRRPDALEQAGPRNIVASRFFIPRLI